MIKYCHGGLHPFTRRAPNSFLETGFIVQGFQPIQLLTALPEQQLFFSSTYITALVAVQLPLSVMLDHEDVHVMMCSCTPHERAARNIKQGNNPELVYVGTQILWKTSAETVLIVFINLLITRRTTSLFNETLVSTKNFNRL